MERPIIEVRDLAKRYRLGKHGRFSTLRDRIAGVLRQRDTTTDEEFWALRDVSFEVRTGEVLGVIGANGAGKSTLLKILSRITEPTSGEITLRGRVASLLEVGTGFHPELTGRENIFLNGVILGMKRAEVARKLDEIVEFSGVEKFLDTPVKRYSSGMYVRLAFAVAAHMDPEILVVDEVLAVGDAEFQKKCLGRMDTLSRSEGRTVLFVSHNMAAIETLTHRALVLESGCVRFCGDTKDAVSCYLKTDEASPESFADLAGVDRPSWVGQQCVKIVRGEILEQEQSTIGFRIAVEVVGEVDGFELVIKINARDGAPLGTAFFDWRAKCPSGTRQTVEGDIIDPGLAPGGYSLSLFILTTGLNTSDAVLNVLPFERVATGDLPARMLNWRPDWGTLRLAATPLRAARDT